MRTSPCFVIGFVAGIVSGNSLGITLVGPGIPTSQVRTDNRSGRRWQMAVTQWGRMAEVWQALGYVPER